jgi:hypothetical protein
VLKAITQCRSDNTCNTNVSSCIVLCALSVAEHGLTSFARCTRHAKVSIVTVINVLQFRSPCTAHESADLLRMCYVVDIKLLGARVILILINGTTSTIREARGGAVG